MTHQISRVAPEVAPKIWPQIEGFIEKALRRGHALDLSTPTDILSYIIRPLLQNGQITYAMHLWVAHDQTNIDAAVVTRFIDWDRARSLYVPIIGGRNMKAWSDALVAELDKFALASGCRDIRGESRQGWARVGGFKVTGVTLERKLT